MANIDYFLISLKEDFFPNSILNDNFHNGIPQSDLSGGEELYIDMTHPDVVQGDKLQLWNKKTGPVILVSNIPITRKACENLRGFNYELVSVFNIENRIKQRQLIAEENQSNFVSVPLGKTRGQIREGVCINKVAAIYGHKETGILFLRSGKIKKTISFYQGIPVDIRSNKKGDLLGNMLVDDEIINEEQAVESHKLAEKENVLQGEALVQMGIISEKERDEALDRQWAIKIIETFNWKEGEYIFKNDMVERPERKLPYTIYELIYNGIELLSPGLLSAFLNRTLPYHVFPNSSIYLRYQPLPNDLDFNVFTRINGQITMEELLNSIKSKEEKNMLTALILCGAVVLSYEPLEYAFNFGGIPINDKKNLDLVDNLKKVLREDRNNTIDKRFVESQLREIHPDYYLHMDEKYLQKARELFEKLAREKKFPPVSLRNLVSLKLGWNI
ncbi:MAG: DUF4388 domain-containing protein [Myxococcota bacterium]